MRSRDDILGSPLAITLQLPRGATHGLLGGSDGMDIVMSPSTMPELSWMTLTGGAEELVVQEALLATSWSCHTLLIHTHHKHGDNHRRGGDDDPLGSPLQVSPSLLQGGEDTSGFHNTFSTSITPLDVGGISLLEDGDGFSINEKLPVLSLDCAFELAVSRIILEHVDHVVEVNEEVINGDNIHCASDPVLSMAKSFNEIN